MSILNITVSLRVCAWTVYQAFINDVEIITVPFLKYCYFVLMVILHPVVIGSLPKSAKYKRWI